MNKTTISDVFKILIIILDDQIRLNHLISDIVQAGLLILTING